MTRVEPPLVGDAVLAGGELGELRMSVPATKASPVARITNTRMAGSASTRSQASTSASYIAHVIALPASGRLNVKNATGPSTMQNSRRSRNDVGHGRRTPHSR